MTFHWLHWARVSEGGQGRASLEPIPLGHAQCSGMMGDLVLCSRGGGVGSYIHREGLGGT